MAAPAIFEDTRSDLSASVWLNQRPDGPQSQELPSPTNDNAGFNVQLKAEYRSHLETLESICTQPDINQAVKDLHNFINTCTAKYFNKAGKQDSSTDETCTYALRDALQWWSYWHGSLDGHHWKHVYVALSTIPEDVIVPPQDLTNGTFRLLSNSLHDMLEGLRKENVSQDSIAFMEMCLLRQYIFQYLEANPPRSNLTGQAKPPCNASWRALTANTLGATTALLAARTTVSINLVDTAARMTVLADALSMESIKEALGGEKATSREDQRHRKQELRGLHIKCLELLDLHPSAPLLSRVASSGPHFVPLMDAHGERIKHARFPMSIATRRRVESYIKT
ncbi:uncharacterized protein N7459_007145 [Penicillium hispanicum]|uniref:uncharacterized protein n=1 Tax=Penicillium hispanicum TaxID=1080232 RepID=UPI0025402B90|nr:uncharacterized protein N7459_007145 [Penicillium hispanicum]KAJ5578181.1 hypothetical protein N7459_007145 [Penicillium hispanicum]